MPRCRVYIDVGQRNNVTRRPYFWGDHALESMTQDFIIDHGTHSLGFLPAEWLAANDYRPLNDDDEDVGRISQPVATVEMTHPLCAEPTFGGSCNMPRDHAESGHSIVYGRIRAAMKDGSVIDWTGYAVADPRVGA
jgi:hypothetical protein